MNLKNLNLETFKNSIGLKPIETLCHTKEALLETAGHSFPEYKSKECTYLQVPCSFDIETSSWYEDGDKRGCMYIWQFGLNGYVLTGRTWPEFIEFVEWLQDQLDLSTEKRLICYVHNFAFEFQWMRLWFRWTKLFSMEKRKIVKGTIDQGIEFRCSYFLSGTSLDTVGKNLTKYKIEKLVGDLDYSKIRHSRTPLTDQEMGYCINDVRVVMAYIQECIERDGNISKIQLTKTGYVRKQLREACMYPVKSHKKKGYAFLKYRKLMDQLTTTPEEYQIQREAFAGGFTHTNAFLSGKVLPDIRSKDETSAYPTMMVAKKYPMSRGKRVRVRNAEEFEEYISRYACIFRVSFQGLCIKESSPDCYISGSHCKMTGEILNNGRVSYADTCTTAMTSVDWYVVEKVYTWDSFKIDEMWIYHYGYLPTGIVKTVLELYSAKTKLKNVAGMEAEYNLSKEKVNSAYGCMVMDVVRPETCYDTDSGEWSDVQPILEEAIEKYNGSRKRFSTYAWGLFIPAWNRYCLWQAILELGNDYYYSDTDSVKYRNPEKHEAFFEAYNRRITQELETACRYHRLDPELTRPKTVDGVSKPLGVFDDEGSYSRFKALRAKAYMTEKDGKISITVSGVNKKFAVPYLIQKYKDPFKAFSDGLKIPADYTGKLTHTYLDFETAGVVEDYTGTAAPYHERSSIHMEKCSYDMSMSEDYLMYIAEVQNGGILYEE